MRSIRTNTATAITALMFAATAAVLAANPAAGHVPTPGASPCESPSPGGSTHAAPSVSPSRRVSASPSATVTGAAGVAAAPTVGQTPGPDASVVRITPTGEGGGAIMLPVTGPGTAIVAGTGALLLLGGTALVVWARRRRGAV